MSSSGTNRERPPVGVVTAPTSGVDAEPVKGNSMPKVAFASMMGSVIEFYDFNIYGTAAALVFATAFFPALGSQQGTVVAFATLGVAFVARPLGSILFGHFGDRMGRKRTLIATMTTMGTATVLIGVLPTAEAIGVVAPILLVLLRVAQGLAAGGEWAGAALFTSENAPTGRRGFWAMFNNLGGSFANVLALLTFLIASLWMSDTVFYEWGWRLPFIFSILLFIVGLYVRVRLDETPVFSKEVQEGGRAKLPFKDAFVSQWRQIFVGGGAILASFALGYIAVAYLPNFGTTALGLTRPGVLGAGVVGALIQACAIFAGGMLSDRIGRRRILVISSAIAIPWALVLFPLLELHTLEAYWVGTVVTFLLCGFGFGVASSFLPELFPTRYRYTAAGLAYSFSGIIGGALPPVIAASIIAQFGSFAFGIVLAAICALGLVCALAARETKENDLNDIVVPTRRSR
ncbi:MFS transporter [Cnuibacter physcomitrellae]|uniref:MFS transporter n=1 Tax=Cnuibacter physcomitrellae TaxID=1619308 RepID=UPI00217605CB|nr:MFS transporter [Cnuibacter physcomitrellae]MCS5498311.1 MFS transporter [Cnuibacter physcomitrellae]